MSIPLLENQVATGDPVAWNGGRGTFSAVAAAWAGATVSLQTLIPNGGAGAWVTLPADVQLSANGLGNFEIGAGMIRALVTGVPASVYAYVTKTV